MNRTGILGVVFGFGWQMAAASGVEPIFLKDATAVQVAQRYIEHLRADIESCFAVYRMKDDPGAVRITAEIARSFRPVFEFEASEFDLDGDGAVDPKFTCRDSYETGVIIVEALTTRDVDAAGVAELQEWTAAVVRRELETAAGRDGIVTAEEVPLRYYQALRDTETENALTRVENLETVDYRVLHRQWQDLTADLNLDHQFIDPFRLDPARSEGEELFIDLRRYVLPPGVRFVSTGREAVEDFLRSHEGPGPRFAPIANLLKTRAFRKRFYFRGDGQEWSRNVLIVMDERGQWLGFEVGYSE